MFANHSIFASDISANRESLNEPFNVPQTHWCLTISDMQRSIDQVKISLETLEKITKEDIKSILKILKFKKEKVSESVLKERKLSI